MGGLFHIELFLLKITQYLHTISLGDTQTQSTKERIACVFADSTRFPIAPRVNRSVYHSSTPVLVCFKNAYIQTYTVLVIYSYSI